MEKSEVQEEDSAVKKEPEQTIDKQEVETVALLTAEVKILQAENKRLHEQATSLHQKHRANTLKVQANVAVMAVINATYECTRQYWLGG